MKRANRIELSDQTCPAAKAVLLDIRGRRRGGGAGGELFFLLIPGVRSDGGRRRKVLVILSAGGALPLRPILVEAGLESQEFDFEGAFAKLKDIDIPAFPVLSEGSGDSAGDNTELANEVTEDYFEDGMDDA